MRVLYSLFAVLFSVALVLPAAAQSPADGVYKSTDIGGAVETGRYIESWPDTPGAGSARLIGNTFHAQSWNDPTLGGQWEITCPVICSGIDTLFDSVDLSGTGQRILKFTYCGGTTWMDGAGPWGGGDAFYTGTITYMERVATVQYLFNMEVGEVNNVSVEATVDGYDQCVTFAIGNTARVATTDETTLPVSGYPTILKDDCSTAGVRGEWGIVNGITLTVTGCATPTERSTWGRIKQQYR